MSSPLYPEVSKLLEQYEVYKNLLASQQVLSRDLAKQTLLDTPNPTLQANYDNIGKKLQTISNGMTFARPSIWIQYKFKAYKDEAQPIRTLHDFRQHCSRPGYICTKRFDFLNQALLNRGLPQLSDTSIYPDGTLLSGVDLSQLETDDSFSAVWNSYEFFREAGRVAKWENYDRI